MGIAVVAILLAYVPVRLSRGFSPTIRTAIFLIVVIKASVLAGLHVKHVSATGHPIVIDLATDALAYYNAGAALDNRGLFEVTEDDVVAVAGGRSHLGYYVINFLAFKASPEHPMLFLRLSKLLLFHIALGMLATTWRINASAYRAFLAYVLLGLVFYQFLYYNFRNLKDDIILSLFMMVIALADRSLLAAVIARPPQRTRSRVLHWTAVGGLIWAITTLRFYMGAAIIAAFALHLVTARGMRLRHRITLAGVLLVGFALMKTLPGFDLVDERGGAITVLNSLSNAYGCFKMFVTPLPWQHTNIILAPAHTFYLLMLIPALWCLFSRFRANLDWKLFVVLQVALVVGGWMQDFEPRKRYVMYPIFVSWIVMSKLGPVQRRATAKAQTVARSGGTGTPTSREL